MKAGPALEAAAVAAAFRTACRYDVLALKPGNVGIGRPAHAMTARDFLRSAAVCASRVARSDAGIGHAVHASVAATCDAVGCNTNLGILLLAAPLAAAALRPHPVTSLRPRIAAVLDGLTMTDARETFAAIRLANPGGLGTVAEADVRAEPDIELRAAMALAAGRDRIAQEYVNGFAGVVGDGVERLRRGLRRWDSLALAVTACFVEFLAEAPDSHVARKFGPGRAQALMQRAARLESLGKACENPADFADSADALDAELRSEGVNPGTSADLTVASLFALLLSARLADAASGRPTRSQ